MCGMAWVARVTHVLNFSGVVHAGDVMVFGLLCINCFALIGF